MSEISVYEKKELHFDFGVLSKRLTHLKDIWNNVLKKSKEMYTIILNF